MSEFMSISEKRREYAMASLDVAEVDADPIVQFRTWYDNAESAGVLDPNAMTLATASADGRPSARIVLLKEVDARGFVFYTDYRSRKAVEAEANARVALVFYWKEIERQVRVEGAVTRVSTAESEAYFRTRPLGARIGAWASRQSAVISGRDWLEHEVSEVASRFGNGDVPLPPHWGGFRVNPDVLEFWQGRPSRLHDRVRYTKDGGPWRIERLSP